MGGPVKKFPADSVLGWGARGRYTATVLAVALAYFVLAKPDLMLGRGRRGGLRRQTLCQPCVL